MSTVGLSFGSATSGAGFDVTSTVASILAVQSAVETPWKTQQTNRKAQDAAFSGLGTSLSTLSSALASLTSFDGLFASKQGSSSNTSLLSLGTAGPTAIAGSHTVTVNTLAQTSSVYSDRIVDAADTLSGSLTLQVGSGTAQTLALDSSSDTLASLALRINNSSAYGVIASVVTDTQGSRLSLVSRSSGAAGQITLTSNLNEGSTARSVAFTTGQSGLDASLTVDGLGTTSASNTVTGAIPGVTFQLLSASVGTPVQIQITNDNRSIESAMQSFVSSYNSLVKGISAQEGKDASGKAQPLFGDPTMALLQGRLAGALFAGTPSGTISSVMQLGVSVGQDGTLSLDASALDAALNSHFGDALGFFQNSGSFGQNLSSTLDQVGAVSTSGALYLALKQNTAQEDAMALNISTQEALIATNKVTLTRELNTANQILQSIPGQLNQQNEIYNAITGYNPGK